MIINCAELAKFNHVLSVCIRYYVRRGPSIHLWFITENGLWNYEFIATLGKHYVQYN